MKLMNTISKLHLDNYASINAF